MPQVGDEAQNKMTYRWKRWPTVVLLLLAFSLSTFEPIYRFVSMEQFRSSSTSEPLKLGSNPRLCRYMMDRDVVVKFTARVNARSTGRLQNIFQTAAYNDGLRVEIDPTGQVGVVVQDSRSDAELIGVVGLGKLTPGREALIEVEVRKSEYLGIRVNNSTQVLRFAPLAPKCDDVAVGTGFDSTRNFDGSVELVTTIGTLERRTYFGLPYLVRQIGQIFLVLGLVVAFCCRPGVDVSGSRRNLGTFE